MRQVLRRREEGNPLFAFLSALPDDPDALYYRWRALSLAFGDRSALACSPLNSRLSALPVDLSLAFGDRSQPSDAKPLSSVYVCALC